MVYYWGDTMEVWSRMDWYGIWIVGLGYAFFSGGGTKLCKNLKEERLRKAERDLIGVEEEYVHPTLRTNTIPPMGGVITGLEGKVNDKHKQEIRKEQ